MITRYTTSYPCKELTWEDMVIAFSTIPGYVSNRDKERGTWFIQSLCKVISEDVTRPRGPDTDDIFINFLLFFL